MNEADYSAAFAENEKQANIYAARCMRVLAAVVAAIWILNALGVFIVPKAFMAVAGIGGITLLLLPTLLLRLVDQNSPRLKLYILLCCILGITLLSAALPSHAVLAWAVPVVLGCHYYSKRFSYGLWAVSVVCMAISLLIGTYPPRRPVLYPAPLADPRRRDHHLLHAGRPYPQVAGAPDPGQLGKTTDRLRTERGDPHPDLHAPAHFSRLPGAEGI